MRATITLTVAALAAVAVTASAQPRLLPPAQVPTAPPPPAMPSPAPPGRSRAVQVMSLMSSTWTDGGAMPATHAQTGRDVSPPLSWSAVPDGTMSFVVMVRDLDEIAPQTGEDRLHWLVWNVPGSTTALPAGVPEGNAPEPARGPGVPARPPDRLRQISVTGPNYRGPAAPATGPAHHYLFEIFALDTWIDVPAVGQSPSATRAAVVAAMAGHVRGKGVLVGTYRRPAP